MARGIRMGQRSSGQGWKGPEQATSIKALPGTRTPSCACKNNR